MRRALFFPGLCLLVLALLPLRSAVQAASGVPISFQPPVLLTLAGAYHVSVADMDGDGHLDLLCYSRGNACIFYGHGDGAVDSVVSVNMGPDSDTEWAN